MSESTWDMPRRRRPMVTAAAVLAEADGAKNTRDQRLAWRQREGISRRVVRMDLHFGVGEVDRLVQWLRHLPDEIPRLLARVEVHDNDTDRAAQLAFELDRLKQRLPLPVKPVDDGKRRR